ncbi:hypothetical protein LC608_30955 [Nostoc sp. XA010]|uniref:hypothetical protein n=1 Tax=Nostoc sp. XA010 TaxID=2780407 RepID=UPI001E356156|nr:hypothetical protein [Nostoc sp. XA010]MCC5661296.1 hypothetical protein [Nostoc sp. XA010]
MYQRLIANLELAYKKGDMEDAGSIISARKEMMRLDAIAKNLASQGFGIPFFLVVLQKLVSSSSFRNTTYLSENAVMPVLISLKRRNYALSLNL